MKKSLQLILGFCFLMVLAFAGCTKKDEPKAEVDNETQSATDNAIADQEYMAIAPAVNSHAINTKGTGAQARVAAMCDTLTKISGDTLWGTPGHVDPTYTMSISNAACALTMPDGRLRTGHIWLRLTGKIKLPGSQMIVKLISYTAGPATYACDSMIITTVSSNTLCTSFNVALVNGVCTGIATQWTIHYNLNRTIAFYPHGLNGNSSDAGTTIYGTASGVNRSGRAFNVSIPQQTPLLKLASCQYISSGIMQLTPNGLATRTIDFGFSISPAPAGGCDEDASFSVNGSTVAFKLK